MKHRFLLYSLLVLVVLGILLPQATTFAISVIYTTCPTFATLKADAENVSYPNTLTFNVPGGCTIDFGGSFIDVIGDLTILNIGGTVVFDNASYHIYIEDATLTVDNIHFTGAIDYGAIYAEDSVVNISNSRFYNNYSAYEGGAIYADHSTVTITNSVFDSNQADDYGGAIYQSGGEMTIIGCHFENNESMTDYGGAIYVESGDLTVENSSFEGNYASDDSGGAIGAYDSNAWIMSSHFYDNYAYYGGAIEFDSSFVFIGYSSFYNNSAEYGGAIYNYYSTIMVIANSTIYGNYATQEGGGLINDDAEMLLIHVTLADNFAPIGANYQDYFADAEFTATIIINGDCNWDGTLTDGGYNIQFNAPDCVGDDIDPMLGAFTGGYLIPATGSPAIDAIPLVDCIVTDDQIGTSRPQDGGCDIGAIEVGDEVVVPVSPAGPEVLGCVFDTPNGMEIGNVPDNTYCTVLMRAGKVVNYPGAVPENLIGLGVIMAVDVFRMDGGRSITEFPTYGRICLRGNGRMFYMDSRNAPRYPIEMSTERVDGMTCAWIPAPGTLILTER
jgi:predicted outer membrane repeat protein